MEKQIDTSEGSMEKKNNSGLIIGAVVLVVIVSSYFIFFGKPEPESIILTTGEELTLPARSPDISATVLSIEGNEITISRPSVTLTPEEQAETRAERQLLTQEERQALRAERDIEEQIEELVTIPIGVPMIKNIQLEDEDMLGTGGRGLLSNDASGLGDASLYETATFEDIIEGGRISIWEENGAIILVQIKGGIR